MIDPNLERRFAECTELVDAWKLFMELVNRAVKPPKTTNAQLEQQFLNTKARIAILHDSFMESLKDDKQVGANMLEIVNRAITLRMLAKITDPEAKKMEQEWHEVFMLLNGTVSDLNEERARVATINEFTHNMGKMKSAGFLHVKAFFTSIWFKIIAFVAVFVMVVWGGPAMGLYKWDSLRRVSWLKPVVKTYLNVGRDTLGFKFAYYDMDAVMKVMKDAAVPGTFAVEVRTDKNPNDTTTPTMLDGMMLFGSDRKELQTEKDLLLKAKYYEYIRYNADGGVNTAYASIFFMDRTEDANSFMSLFNQYSSQMPDQYMVVRKVNVIILLYSTSKSYLDEVRFKRVDLLQPK
ncbi:hypothetical protein IT570_09535 [Candidatus Sumerlaeota bacterium]|nr:hypothetical protein [Candidatus Sumerlaeota bacterium]